MATRGYGYQYDTNPRKLKPEYTSTKNTTNKKKSQTGKKKVQTQKRQTTVKSKPATNKNNPQKNKKKEEIKAQKKLVVKTKFSIFVKCALLFSIMFFILFRNSQINESFSKIQKLKAEITEIQKENDQIEINIQNSMNANNLEQKAKELLGMQKLTNKQIVHISIPKKDYVEYKAEEIIIDEDTGILEKIIEKIKDLF